MRYYKLFFIFTLFFICSCNKLIDNNKAIKLQLGTRTEKTISNSESNLFYIDLEKDQYIELLIEQQSVDIVTSVMSPSGKNRANINTRLGVVGVERIILVAEEKGQYKFEIKPHEKINYSGNYNIKLSQIKQANINEIKACGTQEIFYDAIELMDKGTNESIKDAIIKFQQVIQVWNEMGNSLGEACALVYCGNCYYLQGDRLNCIKEWRMGIERAKKINDLQLEANCWDSLGLPDLSKTAEEAISCLNKALDLERQIGEFFGEAITSGNISTVYSQVGEYKQALEYLAVSIKKLEKLGDNNNISLALINMASNYSILGEYQNAIDSLNRAIDLTRRTGNFRMEAYTLDNLAQTNILFGDYEVALKQSEEALNKFIKTGDKSGEAEVELTIGRISQLLNDHKKADHAFKHALEISLSTSNTALELMTYNYLASNYFEIGDYNSALDYNSKSFNLAKRLNMKANEAESIYMLGRINQKMLRLHNALSAYKKVLKIYQSKGVKKREAMVLFRIAEIETEKNNLVEAKNNYDKAIEINEYLRSNLLNSDLKSKFFSNMSQFYEQYIELLFKLQKEKPDLETLNLIFKISEKARARSLVDLISEGTVMIRQGVNPKLLEELLLLKGKLTVKIENQFNNVSSNKSKDELGEINEQISRLQSDLQNTWAQIRVNSPKYAELMQPTTVGVSQIQAMLDSDTVVLEYILGNKVSHLLFITKSSIKSYELPSRHEIDLVVKELHSSLIARNSFVKYEGEEYKEERIKESCKNYWEKATKLSKIIISFLGNKLTNKKLLIVADGSLQYLSFGALPMLKKSINDLNNYENNPLIASNEISYYPSSTALYLEKFQSANIKPLSDKIAVFADPVFSLNDERITSDKIAKLKDQQNFSIRARELERSASDVKGVIAFPRLKFTRSEAESIASLNKSTKLYLDFDANVNNATAPEISSYKILHFATHTFLNNQNPELSGLVLSIINKDGQSQQRLLTTNDIFNLKLSADLVVLSACQTGLGKDVRGEGIIGITRGFEYAGVPKVIVSLWNINDEATSSLMSIFYKKYLVENKSVSKSLREAQLEIMKSNKWKDPYYWAPFVLQGDWH